MDRIPRLGTKHINLGVFCWADFAIKKPYILNFGLTKLDGIINYRPDGVVIPYKLNQATYG